MLKNIPLHTTEDTAKEYVSQYSNTEMFIFILIIWIESALFFIYLFIIIFFFWEKKINIHFHTFLLIIPFWNEKLIFSLKVVVLDFIWLQHDEQNIMLDITGKYNKICYDFYRWLGSTTYIQVYIFLYSSTYR